MRLFCPGFRLVIVTVNNMSQSRESAGPIFEAALELPEEQRAAFLKQACADDAALRQRVEALLRAHEAAGTFMENPVLAAMPNTPDFTLTDQSGERIGRYKLLQQIGESGCGVVYMAEQERPVRRRVALKVIKLGMDTRQVIARFEAERQALALMDHPNIAKVLDAGATEAGRPFFVMELVVGEPSWLDPDRDAEPRHTGASQRGCSIQWPRRKWWSPHPVEDNPLCPIPLG
jgi:hypothetical protein